MTLLPDNSVHLAITSPPYWQLKDYGTDNQIGFHDSYENYINNLNLVWKECYRTLHNGCRLCVNIGDQFARAVYYGRYKVIPIREEIIKFCENIGRNPKCLECGLRPACKYFKKVMKKSGVTDY